jgi:hypothetical protein
VQASDLGDIHPRKVAFFVQTGRTLVRRLPATRDRELVDVERAYREQLSQAAQRQRRIVLMPRVHALAAGALPACARYACWSSTIRR